ncbi:MAG: response regulator [Bdellovibrionaceae bacterium]|jgi:putative nucleotidyltransferase with HDIG domain|nr:response regulator [Pseudobdellovibrionaceae bacterium]
MKKVLIVEDDEFLRTALNNVLSASDFDVSEAPNGKVAKDIIKGGSFSLILSDIQMPYLNGVELLEWVREQERFSSLPFVLMTGFAHIVETKTAFELGANEFLTKPFEDDELLEKINSLLKSPNETEDPAKKKELEKPVYCKVSIEDFVSDKDIDLDIFIRLSKEKYIKIAHKGGKLPEDQIRKYKEKGVTQLYIKKEDFAKIIDFNVKLSKLVVANTNVPREKKNRFLTHTGEVILEQTFSAGVNKESFDNAKDFLMVTMDLLTEEEQTLELLDVLNGHSDLLYAHCLGVSIYSGMIGRQMGWTSAANLFKLSFGGLLHDVGKKEIDPELLEKARAQLSYKERQIIESHAIRGKAILESLKSAPSEVVAIAYQHHENIIGHGYPQQLSKQDIHPMAKIVSVANEFCNYALNGHHSPPVPGAKAIQLMEELKSDTLDPVAFKALRELFSE